MLSQDRYAHAKYGIAEIYFHENLTQSLLEKLYHRAKFSLDAEDPTILRYASHDIILIFDKITPTPSLIYQFLKFLDRNGEQEREKYIKDNTLLNEEELFSALKSKNFILITHRNLIKQNFCPD